MRLQRFRYSGVLVIALLLSARWEAAAAEKEWVTLNDCHYVDSENNDGDSFHARCGDREFTARLYYVDALETNLVYPERTREQAEHFGITLDEALQAGAAAKQRVAALLQKPFIVHTRWANAAGRARDARYYAIIEIDGKSLAEILVSEGLARAKGTAAKLPSGEKARDYMERLAALEDDARQKRVGAWADSAENDSR